MLNSFGIFPFPHNKTPKKEIRNLEGIQNFEEKMVCNFILALFSFIHNSYIFYVAN